MTEHEMTADDLIEALDALDAGDTVPVEALRKLSDAHKPGGSDYDEIAGKLEALAEDGPAAKALVTEYLHKVKLGYEPTRGDPIMASGLLAWLVERVANLLDAPPSYRFRSGTKLLSDTGAIHEAASEIVESMDLTSALRKLHRLAVTSGQAYMRVYDTGDEGGLQPRVFGAAGVLRVPHPALADRVQHDRVFALPLSGGLLEVHWQGRDGDRRMVWCTAKGGAIVDGSPYLDTANVTGLDLLPVVRLASEATVGAPYVAPRASRVTYTLSVSSLQNDLHAIAALQAHNILVWLQSDTRQSMGEDAQAQAPDVGPGSGWKAPPGDRLEYLKAQPLISDVMKIVMQLLRTFLLGEHVPQHEAQGDAVRTGQALLVAERGLQARSEAMRPLLTKAAVEVWDVVRDLGVQGGELELVMQLAPQRVPATAREILEDLAKTLALDMDSRVGGMMRLHNCSRAEAIERIEQVDADLEAYGKGAAADVANRSGGGFTENLNAGEGAGENFDSVADAVRGRTAGEARADRREGEAA